MMRHPSLLAPGLRARDLAPLQAWGHRIGLQARDALHMASAFRSLLEQRTTRIAALSGYFGLDAANNALHLAPHRWLRVTETQATRGLAVFLREGGSDRALSFLKAIDPDIEWPSHLTDLEIETEVAAGGGRIDLLVRGSSDGRRWGAVVEAKFGHDLKSNPLPHYALHAKTNGFVLNAGGDRAGATGTLVVLALRRSQTTTRRLSMNRRWRLLHWSALLRRFEAELRGRADDDDFRRFRRTLWDRIA